MAMEEQHVQNVLDISFLAIDIECKSTLAPALPLGTKVFIGVTKDGPVATEHNPQQLCLPVDEKPAATVTQLRAAGGAQ
jgi:hypothetical protein